MKGKPSRVRHLMREDIRAALEGSCLMQTYAERPPYQQNDYLGWIEGAKTTPTREKRLRQMLEELEKGGVYMGMEHNPSKKLP